MSGGDMSSGGQGGREVIPVVPQAMSREGSISLHYPMLNKSNYSAWCIKMEVYMEAQGVWEAVVSQEPVELRKDKMALAAIYQSISEETLLRLGAKKTAKEAWETLKTMHLGAGRVKEVRAQALRWELEGLQMKDTETIDDFTGKVTITVNHLRSLGEEVLESYVVKKILRAVSPKFLQIASTIEEFGDLENKTIEEVTGSLKAHEERMRGHDNRNEDQVLLIDAELKKLNVSKHGERFEQTHHDYDRKKGPWRGGSSFRGHKRSNGDGERNKFPAERRMYRDAEKPQFSAGRRTFGDEERRQRYDRNKQRFDISKIKCYACNEYGHFASNCRTENTRREEAHIAEDEGEEPALLMMEESDMFLSCEITEKPNQQVESQPRETERNKSLSKANWHYDTGASNHMTGNKEMLVDLDETVKGNVKFGDGSLVEIKGQGSVLFECSNGEHLTMSNVYYIPQLRSNIISLGQLDENGAKIVLEDGYLRVYDASKRLIAKVPRAKNRLYTLQMTQTDPVCLEAKITEDSWLWHARYGHLNFQALRRLTRERLVRGLPELTQVNKVCDCCAISKQHRISFPKTSTFQAKDRLQLVHGDLCGPISPETMAGNKYFLLLVDDFTKYMWVEFLKDKKSALTAFKKVKNSVELETNQKMKMLRSDRGGEFTSEEFVKFCDETGLKRQLTAPYSPQQNGIVERRNQTVMEMTRSILKGKGVPNNMWAEAVKTSVYLLNRCPTKGAQGEIPYKMWFGKEPEVTHFRVFGCVAHVKDVKPHIKKLDDRSQRMVFIGYETGSKAYRFFEPKSKCLKISRDAIFLENEKWDWNQDISDSELRPDSVLTIGFQDSPAPEVPAQKRGESSTETSVETKVSENREKEQSDEKTTFQEECDDSDDEGPRKLRSLQEIYDNTVEEGDEALMCLLSIDEPTSYDEAATKEEWRLAMLEEMSSITRNGTWELAVLPKGAKAIGLKWVYKIKKDPNGNILKHKARIVAKGYAQRYGVDFDEVFAPVARLETVRLLLALAAQENWSVHHMDVKSAFLNGELKEEVYVVQPPGFDEKGHEDKVLKLRKALYGLKQAPRAWNAKLDECLVDLGYQKCPLEHAVYKKLRRGDVQIVGVYVDDLIIMGSNKNEIGEFKEQMKQRFEMSDLGELSYYLGIEVKQNAEYISLCQANYAWKVLEKLGMSDCKPCSVPMDSRIKLTKEDQSPLVDATMYRSAIGSLRYLLNTRPDLTYSVGVVSRYMETPTSTHYGAVKQILRYIKGTTNHGCKYFKKQAVKNNLIGYCDSDLAGDIDDRKSTTGVIYFLGSSPVTWLSQKQKVVALSSCEAEYISATAASCQGIWLQRLLGDLKGEGARKVVLKIDNRSAIDLSKNSVYHVRSKHIDIKYHFVRDCVQKGEVELSFVRTEDQVADLLTKALPRGRFEALRELIGVMEVKTQMD